MALPTRHKQQPDWHYRVLNFFHNIFHSLIFM